MTAQRGRPRRKLNRERIKASIEGVHPTLHHSVRLEMILPRLIDALCDELEGVNTDGE